MVPLVPVIPVAWVGHVPSRRIMMRMSGNTASAIAILALVVASGAPALRGQVTVEPTQAVASDLDQALDAITEAGMPGALARVSDEATSWRGASGVADIDTNRPMRPDFPFRIGSITKTFVATLVLQHVAEGRIGLDDPIALHLPDVLPAELGGAVTIRMLLNHTSGVPDYDTLLWRENADLERHRFALFTPIQLIELALTDEPGTPGQTWAYSNTNYILLGILVERVSGHSVQFDMIQRIIRPLQLRGTWFPYLSPYLLAPHSESYVPVGTPERPLVDFSVYTPTVFSAAGAMVSTAQDLERFFRALLTGELLPPEQLRAMQTTVSTDFGLEYGLGLVKFSLCDTFWGHDGVVWGQQTISFTSADGQRHVTLGTNMSHYAAGPNPIDQASTQFLLQAACPTAPMTTLSGTWPRTPAPGRQLPQRPARLRDW
ncbi:MAG: serine hydrolase [Luteitalea sp.]|nr:serine hydrolase [Luteitalea sp.]